MDGVRTARCHYLSQSTMQSIMCIYVILPCGWTLAESAVGLLAKHAASSSPGGYNAETLLGWPVGMQGSRTMLTLSPRVTVCCMRQVSCTYAPDIGNYISDLTTLILRH